MNLHGIEQSITEHIKKLTPVEQQKVLNFIKKFSKETAKGKAGKDLLVFASSIDKKDIDLMSEAISQDCEKVNTDEW